MRPCAVQRRRRVVKDGLLVSAVSGRLLVCGRGKKCVQSAWVCSRSRRLYPARPLVQNLELGNTTELDLLLLGTPVKDSGTEGPHSADPEKVLSKELLFCSYEEDEYGEYEIAGPAPIEKVRITTYTKITSLRLHRKHLSKI